MILTGVISFRSPTGIRTFPVWKMSEDKMTKGILSLAAIATLTLALVPASAVAQQKSLKEQLVGTWNITAVTVDRPDGTKLQPFGPSPKGVIMFTNDGHFALVNTRPGRSKFASNNRLDGTPEENKATTQGS